MMILLLGLIIVGAIYAAGGFRGGPMRRPEENRDRALQILQERYARGEIDSKEYEEKKRALAS
ncbi:MAG: SHOCT domain-containing protein [Candidatus Aquicultor sp.]